MIWDPDHRSAWVQDLKHFLLFPGLRFALPRLAMEKNRKKYDYFHVGSPCWKRASNNRS